MLSDDLWNYGGEKVNTFFQMLWNGNIGLSSQDREQVHTFT